MDAFPDDRSRAAALAKVRAQCAQWYVNAGPALPKWPAPTNRTVACRVNGTHGLASYLTRLATRASLLPLGIERGDVPLFPGVL